MPGSGSACIGAKGGGMTTGAGTYPRGEEEPDGSDGVVSPGAGGVGMIGMLDLAGGGTK
ncbi:MAG: hypothetical protein JWL90_2963 [Chthoniobacteraceae bacterium]|nr:hypothetical protein [Chthoniobacteraceae bacterium]